MPAVEQAVRNAEEALTQGPWSVTQCPHAPPSGDFRDYYSIAKYYWPCNANPCGKTAPKCDADSGLPWVDCDGLVNPITNEYALPRIDNTTGAVAALAAGYLWSGRAEFAARAALLLRAFFTDPATGMHPSLTYAQAEPGTANGSHWGIIELSSNFVELVLDSIAFIEPSGHWTAADQGALLAWLAQLAAWLRDSAEGAQEAVAFNNHQIWYTVLRTAAEAWLGNATGAVALLRGTLAPPPAGNAWAPLGVQIAPGGQLPAEEARTNSGGYVNFASRALLQLGLIARAPALVAAGAPDLLTYVTAVNHTGIQPVVDFMVPFVLGQRPWPFQNITHTPWAIYAEEYARAAHVEGWDAATRAGYAAVAAHLNGNVTADWTTALFWPLQ